MAAARLKLWKLSIPSLMISQPRFSTASLLCSTRVCFKEGAGKRGAALPDAGDDPRVWSGMSACIRRIGARPAGARKLLYELGRGQPQNIIWQQPGVFNQKLHPGTMELASGDAPGAPTAGQTGCSAPGRGAQRLLARLGI